MHNLANKIFKSLILIAIVAILAANSKTITSSIRSGLLDGAVSPLNFFHSLISASKRIIPFASLREDNKALRQKVELLTRKLEEARIVYDENERLKNFINFRKTISYSTLPAQVIGRDPSNWSNSLIVDKGLTGGVRQNRAVLSTKGLVGRVLEVGRTSSKILLITDPNSKVGVLIQRNRQGGVLVGRPDGRCKMVYIALDSDVAPGDKVITAGSGSIFPKNIMVGEVMRIEKQPGRLYKNAIVKTSEDLSRLEEVLCIR